MKTKYFSVFILLFVVTSMFSQKSLNNYKYIIVSKKFDFLKEKDQYQLNSLTKFLFNKYGFQALMEGSEYPEDLIRNRCLALNADVLKDSGMFKTKLNIEIKNCNDKIVYTSQVGESRAKEFERSYNEALRNAFKSIAALNYKYEPKNEVASVQPVVNNTETSKEIEQLREELETLKNQKKLETSKTQTLVKPDSKPIQNVSSNILYAQEVKNGFQLVDSSPKLIYKIKTTGLNNVFLVENKNAILYKKGDNWVIEYYMDNVLKTEALNIKF